MMVAASKSLGKTQLRYLEALQLFLGILLNRKEESMNERTFYPTINRSMKNLLALATKDNSAEILQIIINYPKCNIDDTCPPLQRAVSDELGRQFMRWNKK